MDDTPTTLLVAERDDELREFLVDQFLADRFASHGAGSAEETRFKLAHVHPDVLLLGELEQPHAHLSLLRGIRADGFDGLPVLVVSADGSELAQLRAFRGGAPTTTSRNRSATRCFTPARERWPAAPAAAWHGA